MDGPGRLRCGHVQQKTESTNDDEHADDQQEERHAGALVMRQHGDRYTQPQHYQIDRYDSPSGFECEEYRPARPQHDEQTPAYPKCHAHAPPVLLPAW